MLFDWLIVGQVLPFNPASSVRGPKHVVKTGKTPVLSGGADNRISTGAPAGMMTPESGCGSVSRRLTVSRGRGMNPHGDLERRSNFHQGQTPPGPRQEARKQRLRTQFNALATRKPRSLLRDPVAYLTRYAERTNLGSSSHEPPRNTRRRQFHPLVLALPSVGAPA